MVEQKISIGMLVGAAVIEAVLLSAGLVALHRAEWARVAVPAAMFVTLICLLSCPRRPRIFSREAARAGSPGRQPWVKVATAPEPRRGGANEGLS
jgi:hypothetical protein